MPRTALHRRDLLAGTCLLLAGCGAATRVSRAEIPGDALAGPPAQVRPGVWMFFTPEEATQIDALVDRLIPADALGPGAKQAGCTLFIDRQLAGPFGSSARLYMRPPFADGTPQQGLQSPRTPAEQYRIALAALGAHVRAGFAGQALSDLPAPQRDALLTGLERGQVKLDGADGRAFFELLLQNTMEGFFADPIYGGNRDMVGWKLIGFPGAR